MQVRPKLVSLDATGTLFRVRGSVGEAYARAAEAFGVHGLRPASLTRGFFAAWRDHNVRHPNFGHGTELSSYNWWSSLFGATLAHARPELSHSEEFAADVFPKLFDQVWHDFTRAEAWEVFPETEPVIKTLRSNGIKVAVVSNFDERLPLLLKNLGLDHLFDVVLPSCYAGVAKPDPDIFYQALRKANVEGSEAVHVGDDYKKDYRGAKDAGLSRAFLMCRDAVALEKAAQVPPADILHNLSDLLPALGLQGPT